MSSAATAPPQQASEPRSATFAVSARISITPPKSRGQAHCRPGPTAAVARLLGLALASLPLLPPCVGVGPVGLEDVHDLADHLGVADDHADLAPGVELQPLEAHAAHERAAAVP